MPEIVGRFGTAIIAATACLLFTMLLQTTPIGRHDVGRALAMHDMQAEDARSDVQVEAQSDVDADVDQSKVDVGSAEVDAPTITTQLILTGTYVFVQGLEGQSPGRLVKRKTSLELLTEQLANQGAINDASDTAQEVESAEIIVDSVSSAKEDSATTDERASDTPEPDADEHEETRTTPSPSPTAPPTPSLTATPSPTLIEDKVSATPTAQLINPFVIESLNLPTTPIAVDELAPHSDDTVNVAMADAEPNVEPSPTVATVLSEPPALTSTDLSGDSEVWDPRFYRGSYRFDPEINRLTPIVNEDLKPASSGEEDSVSSVGAATSELPGPDQDGTFPRRGLAMYYNPGIMDQVLDFRLMAGHVENCPECIGYAALLTRVDLNQRVWIEWENGDIEGPFLVIDAAAIQHVDMLNRRGWVIDVDYDTAMRRGMNRPLAVTVWTAHPE